MSGQGTGILRDTGIAIGMLGGMGPESTSYTYMRMIRYCQERYGASLDSDFPQILIYSMPIPDVVEEGSIDAQILSLLGQGIGKLDRAGASFSLIACNTMQGFIPDLRKRFDMLSLVEETAREAGSSNLKRLGILATEVTLRKGFYQQALSGAGVETILPDRKMQSEVTKAIRLILSGSGIAQARSALIRVADSFERQGADGVVLACTDLPIAFRGKDTSLAVLDTADICARAAVERYRGLCRI
jgi:aspartate racemase